jgi:signal transduction histidine kinase
MRPVPIGSLIGGAAMTNDALARQNATLNEQVKLLLRTEKRLYQTRTHLETQLTRIRALNEFSLAAMRTLSPIEILTQAIELVFPLFTVQAVVAVLYTGPEQLPTAVACTVDTPVEPVAVPAGLETMPALGAPNRSRLIGELAAGDPVGPIARWLEQVARPIEGDLRNFAGYVWRDVVLSVGGTELGVARAVVAFRSATVTHFTEVVGDADLPFIEVICQHVSRSMETTALYATLEQRVQDRTIALRQSNEQLAESLERLQSTQRQLVEASRRAGMSDVATSVLHNVGNVLNSVNVSATLVEERVTASKARRIRQVADMVRAHRDDLPRFFTQDPRGKLLPDYLEQLSHAIDADQDHAVKELVSLRRNVDHIKAIVGLQQDFAKPSAGVTEPLEIAELIDDAARFDEVSYRRHGVVLERRFESAIPIVSDRHKILQILTNLLSNARHAVSSRPPDRRQVIVHTTSTAGHHVIEVQDTGCGIAPEHLHRVFSLGFTTRVDGHGFGLHSSACSAAELGGQLTVHSDGIDRGAVFRLTLPIADPARPGR